MRRFIVVMTISDDGLLHDPDDPEVSQPESPAHVLTSDRATRTYLREALDLDAGISVEFITVQELIP